MSGRRVLLVDDEVSLTRSLALYLEAVGACEVKIENIGSRALAAARAFDPDLVILDIVMPDVDGGTIAAELAADPALRDTPVLFLTALVSQQETGGEAQRIGGRPFLAKPVDPDVVLAAVERYARR